MFESAGEYVGLVNIIFLAATAAIAVHAIRFRDANGESDWVRLLFGTIAAVFFFKVLFGDVLNLVGI